MNYGTVCSGIGAPEVAWKGLWGRPAFTSEIEAFPSAVLKHHMPDVVNHGDMTKYKEWPDHELGLICGGTPCQSFSVAGLRKGMDDPRGNLTLTYLGIIDRYRPRWFIWENVPGVHSSASHDGPDEVSPPDGLEPGREWSDEIDYEADESKDFGCFIAGIQELGYSCAGRVLDAQFYGVPQRRRRVFIVGYLGNDWRPPFAVLFERASLSGHPPPSGKSGEDVAGYAASSIGGYREGCGTVRASGGDLGGGSETLVCDKIAKPLTAHGGPHGRQNPTDENYVIGIDEECNASIDKFGPLLRGGQGGTRQAVSIHARQDPITVEGKALPLDTKGNTQAVAIDGYNQTVSDKAQSLRSGRADGDHQGIVMLNTIVRRLTPRECERLQGFPDDYTLIPDYGSSKTHYDEVVAYLRQSGYSEDEARKLALHPDGVRYKALGNSMAVPVVRWIGERIQMWEEIHGRA